VSPSIVEPGRAYSLTPVSDAPEAGPEGDGSPFADHVPGAKMRVKCA